MGNHHSQSAAEFGPGWSRTIPRERTAGRLLGYGRTPALQPFVKVLPDRVPGQKLRISASLPTEGVAASGANPSGDLQRFSPQGRSQSRLLREEDEDEEDEAEVLRTHGSEPDLREVGGPGRRKIVRRRVSPGSRKLRAPPPPELTLPPPPGEPPPPLPTQDQPPAAASSSRRRLFRPQAQRRPAAARLPPAVRAVSEERSAAADDGGGRARARSVDCLQAVLRQRGESVEEEEEKERGRTGSLPRRHVEREVPEVQQERSRSVLQHRSDLNESRATSRSEGALQAACDWSERTETTRQSWRNKGRVVPEPDEAPKRDDWDDHRIKITVATNNIQVGGSEENKPKLVFFGMENGPAAAADMIVPDEGRVSALTKVKRNEEVSITGARVSYRRPAEHRSGSASRGSTASGESGAPRASNLQRISTQKLTDFMSTLERSKRRQLSANRDEILTNSPARSYRSQSSVFDCELQVGNESISMHLRPSLPKKQQQMPRFSPLAAWKSLHLDEAARRDWREEPLAKQPLRDQLCRHPPITQSADSGIGGDAGSPPPPSPETSATTGADTTSAELPRAASSPAAVRPGCWTPAQDLEEASSGDDASLAAAERRQGTLPKLTSRGGMFTGSERPRAADGRSTVGVASGAGVADRSSKTSAERPAQSPAVSLDQNWLLSRSVPSSLNADTDLTDAPARSDASRHVMYLPEYHSMRVERGRSISPHGRDVTAASLWDARGTSADRASPEKPPRVFLASEGRRKFAFQGTLRLIEKKKLETQLSREAEEKERQRREEQEAMQRVESEFRQKRLRESQSVQLRHRLSVSQLETARDGAEDTGRPAEHPTSSDVSSSGSDSDRGFSSHKESPQSSPRSVSDAPLPQFKLPAPGVAGRGDAFWEEAAPPECPPPDYNSLPPLLDQHPISLPPEQPLPPTLERMTKLAAAAATPATKADRPRLLSGVRNWLRGRRDGGRPSGGNMANMHREEPEGEAASSPDRQAGPAWGAAETRWRHSSGQRQQQQKSADRMAGDMTDDSRGEPAPASPADSAGPTPSSGYESSPSLDTSKRLTQELGTSNRLTQELGTSQRLTQELQEQHQERREYRDYRTPASRSYRYKARSPSTPEGFSPSRQSGRKTPTSVYSEPQSKSGRHSRPPPGVPVESQSEAKSSRPVILPANYRRAFAWGSAGHPAPPLMVPAVPSERNWRTPNSLTGSENARTARTGQRLQGFQRSLSHHELHFRGSRPVPAHPDQYPVSRGRSEERLDGGGHWRLHPPPPGRAPPHPQIIQRRGYVPRYINNSPARFIHGVEHNLLSGGHRPLTLLPPRPASAFPT